ncbi:unnamed protein product [Linum trigynum]|uniref:F-box domain-containing protein n=1 Tax=Linum trigynum TaxID=586398 RepID=A0AAV2CNY4_9ROSI
MSDAARSWADLPGEVLNLIRRRLLRKDYSNFRATCSSWNFKAGFDPLVYENVKYPFLLCFPKSSDDDDDDHSYAAYYKAYSAAYNKTYHIRTSSQLLVDAHVFYSADGWLLLGRGHQAFFYHPSTQDMIKLPVIRTDCKVPFGWMKS